MIRIHVAYIGMKKISAAGTVLADATATYGDVMTSSSEQRVLEDSAVPNTAGNPTIKRYLELEAADNYVVQYMGQSMIVTYDQSDVNSV